MSMRIESIELRFRRLIKNLLKYGYSKGEIETMFENALDREVED